ncbi:MAG: helicase C-terminal domain-containing protein, partial [Phormidium sp.]
EKQVLSHLFAVLNLDQEDSITFSSLPVSWQIFWQRFTTPGQMYWVQVARTQGLFTIYCGPIDVAEILKPIWLEQPVVLIGGALELEAQAPIYRQQLGLGDLTCLKFSLDRHSELIQLYVPDSFPMPNTPQFQAALLQEIRRLLIMSAVVEGLTVLLVSDVPLKAQVGAEIAAEFGSRVQVEKTCLDDNGILITGWEFWLAYQDVLPAPHLLLIATLPIPSLENPMVAGRVAYYKQQRQDWFRLYLLPAALNVLQRAIAPVRTTQGVVALLDSRTIHRSYGQQVLTALSPFARINYLDPNLFS